MNRIRIMAATTAFLIVALGSAAGAFPFGDIRFWVGSGDNQAAFVIDWNNGKTPESLAWGYRWGGAATGKDMLNAVVSTDPRLYANFRDSGNTVYGLGYDADNDGFTYVPGPNDTGHAADPDDHYREGWMYAGYWSYYASTDGTNWDYAPAGFRERTLSSGDWDGWVFAPSPTWDGGVPSTPAAAEPIPEPGSLVALALGFGSVIVRKRR